jgi:nucleoside-diphosphate-sugar epimerase
MGRTAALLLEDMRPRQWSKNAFVLAGLVSRRIKAGRRVPMFGSGDVRIQMCDAEDFANAALAAIDRRANDDYNIAAAEFNSVRENLETSIAHAGTSARLQPLPVWGVRAVLRAFGAVGRSPLTEWHWVSSATPFWCELDKAERELGWHPVRSNADALSHAYDIWLVAPEEVGDSAHARPLQGALARMLRG